ncbi:MAG: hypothetical protein Kow0077_07020 [Anaerolineae bacterium]
MRGLELVGWGIVLLCALLGSTLLPYLLLFGLRKAERVGCGLAVVVVLGGLAFGVMVGLVVRPVVVANLAVPQIQAALESACGPRAEQVTVSGVALVPYYRWLGEEAGCVYTDFLSEWECYCDAQGDGP